MKEARLFSLFTKISKCVWLMFAHCSFKHFLLIGVESNFNPLIGFSAVNVELRLCLIMEASQAKSFQKLKLKHGNKLSNQNGENFIRIHLP